MQQLLVLLLTILLFPAILSSQHEIVRNGSDIYLIPKDLPHTETLIYLHGLMAYPQVVYDKYFSFEPAMIARKSTKVVFLTAPTAPVTVLEGRETTSWFDIRYFTISTENEIDVAFNLNDIAINGERIKQIMRDEIQLLGGNSSRLFIGGFSQGCVMSLYCGLTFEQTIGGIIGSSGYLVSIAQATEANSRIPLFLSHGKIDYTILFGIAESIYETRLDSTKHHIQTFYEDSVDHDFSLFARIGAREWFFNLTTLSEVIIKPIVGFTLLLHMIIFF